MKRVIGLGGPFIKANDPAALAQWYERHLGIAFQCYGDTCFAQFAPSDSGYQLVSLFAQSSDYFAPSSKATMINFIVADLAALIEQLQAEGVTVDPKRESGEYGDFAWVMDPEGNKIELWQPPGNHHKNIQP